MVRTLACSVFGVLPAVTALSLRPVAQANDAITIWRVGSPYTGAVPQTVVPPAFARDAATHGWSLRIQAFPAQGFAARFAAAAKNGAAPDVVVFDNFGIMNGASTPLGTFTGIGADPVVRKQLVQITTSFDELLLPARGWAFLFTHSAHYANARALATRTPRCADTSALRSLPADLPVSEVAAAYLTADSGSMRRYAEDQRLPGFQPKGGVSGLPPIGAATKVGRVAVCGGWGNDRLVVASATASYQADTAVGHAPLVLVFQKVEGWQLLAASRDPVTNRDFLRAASRLSEQLVRDLPLGALPLAALLRSPEDG